MLNPNFGVHRESFTDTWPCSVLFLHATFEDSKAGVRQIYLLTCVLEKIVDPWSVLACVLWRSELSTFQMLQPFNTVLVLW